ncbi:MAG: DUF6436 domain-containing protein [Puniceicoccaceae bacterium]|nr:DUF6436 domain-containing protein [Puniceicoccaceae bacterium]
MITVLTKVGVALWIMGAAAFLFITGAATVTRFDADNVLYQATFAPDFDDKVHDSFSQWVGSASSISQTSGSPGPIVLHVVDNTCPCQMVSNRHVNSIEVFANRQSIPTFRVNYESLPADVQQWIPSTPALVITDSAERVNYIGPYGEGANCASNTDIATPFIGMAASDNYGVSVPFEAKGCYCKRS